MMDRGPIFIGGLDRSGKTLMRLALSTHPDLALSRRTYMWTRFYNQYGDLGQNGNFERCLKAMLNRKSIRFLSPDPERIRREFRQGEPTYARLFALFHMHFAQQLGRPRWGEQAGLIERYADPILAAYPSARIIHMIRDPRNRYEEILLSSPPRVRLGKVGATTSGWLYSANLAKRNLDLYAGKYKVVFYEALVSQPEETLREVCGFIQEDFVPQMLTLEGALRFGDADGVEAGLASDWENGIVEFNQAAQGAITRREVAFMQDRAQSAMRRFGYRLSAVRFSPAESVRYYFDLPFNLVRMAAWRAGEGPQAA
jgi:hypothetical protein